MFVFKVIKHRHLLPTVLHFYLDLNSDVHGHQTRNIDAPRVERYLKDFGKRHTRYHGVTLLNELPTGLKEITTIALFSKKLFEYYVAGLDDAL